MEDVVLIPRARIDAASVCVKPAPHAFVQASKQLIPAPRLLAIGDWNGLSVGDWGATGDGVADSMDKWVDGRTGAKSDGAGNQVLAGWLAGWPWDEGLSWTNGMDFFTFSPPPSLSFSLSLPPCSCSYSLHITSTPRAPLSTHHFPLTRSPVVAFHLIPASTSILTPPHIPSHPSVRPSVITHTPSIRTIHTHTFSPFPPPPLLSASFIVQRDCGDWLAGWLSLHQTSRIASSRFGCCVCITRHHTASCHFIPCSFASTAHSVRKRAW
ncbi:hypothetical protein BC567DRAFT_233590 [Phyllosticta citribraziliensis]